MSNKVEIGGLKIDPVLYDLIKNDIAPGTDIDPDEFWKSLGDIVRALAPKNRALLDKRDAFQSRLDAWYKARKGQPIDPRAYRSFLIEIGYLGCEGEPFDVTTANVDPEIAKVAGPQLVVPVDNARYALNAANARWGSLYDALYGTDVVPDSDYAVRGDAYNPVRGQRVVEAAEAFLDDVVPLASGKYGNVTSYALVEQDGRKQLRATLKDGSSTGLTDASQLAGFVGDPASPDILLLRHNGLHIEIHIDADHPVGKAHAAGVKDVVLESAVTTILDCEDSVAAVDAEDKARVYANLTGIMKGGLATSFQKAGHTVVRSLKPDRTYIAPNGSILTLPGRSMLLVRNVGLHMYTDAVTTADDEAIPEGFLDAMVTVLSALHDLKKTAVFTNSRAGSIYIVKPKMHGPEEVAATVELFGRVEDALRIERNTIKIGIMDEERRMTINLKSAIKEARERIIFINTGFLDRTGDEIHTRMEAGAVLPKPEIKKHKFMSAYEDWNVDIGLETAIPGHGQIGKGMWAMPDQMKAMVDSKSAHPNAGATCAWVPSPTAATLHAIHYHRVTVADRQIVLSSRSRASLDDILAPPLLDRDLNDEEIQRELANNAQGILGYVVRWIDQGIGCSKVPDINNVGLMEDRATLRISSQHIANWLHHGIVTRDQCIDTFKKMAVVVDKQNAGDPAYKSISPSFNSTAWHAALDLVFTGCQVSNGYTESVLHRRRREAKVAMQSAFESEHLDKKEDNELGEMFSVAPRTGYSSSIGIHSNA